MCANPKRPGQLRKGADAGVAAAIFWAEGAAGVVAGAAAGAGAAASSVAAFVSCRSHNQPAEEQKGEWGIVVSVAATPCNCLTNALLEP